MKWNIGSDSLLVEPNPDLGAFLRDRLAEKYSQERKGIHLSDLTLCLRQSWFKHNLPKPPTDEQILFYVDGASRHVVLQNLYGEASEAKGVYRGVSYSIDILDDKTPVELKTTRARKSLSDHWFTQTAFYMVCSGQSVAHLIVMRVNSRGKNPFEYYELRWRNEGSEGFVRREFERRSERLCNALANGRTKGLPRVPRYPSEFPCKNCLWKVECGRYP